MISHKHKCIFVHIPKCGGKSIEQVFIADLNLDWNSRLPLLMGLNSNRKVGPPSLSHLTIHEMLSLNYINEDILNEYRKFTVVRNPLNRCYSMYRYLGYHYVMTFRDFVDNVVEPALENKNSEMHYFFKPQIEFLETSGLNVDNETTIFKLEGMGEDILNYLHELGIEIFKLPHINKSQKFDLKKQLVIRSRLFRSGYLRSILFKSYDELSKCENTRAKIRNLYKDDYEKFEY
jgi:hypothetical protein